MNDVSFFETKFLTTPGMRCKDFGWHPDSFLYISFCSEQAHLSNESWTYVAHSWGWEGLRNTVEKLNTMSGEILTNVLPDHPRVPPDPVLSYTWLTWNQAQLRPPWVDLVPTGRSGLPCKTILRILEYPRNALEIRTPRGWCKTSIFSPVESVHVGESSEPLGVHDEIAGDDKDVRPSQSVTHL